MTNERPGEGAGGDEAISAIRSLDYAMHLIILIQPLREQLCPYFFHFFRTAASRFALAAASAWPISVS